MRDLTSGVFSQIKIVLRVFGEGHSADLIDLSSLLTFQFRDRQFSRYPSALERRIFCIRELRAQPLSTILIGYFGNFGGICFSCFAAMYYRSTI
jgi:hypothetical protein